MRLATVCNYDDLIAALRARMDELHVSNAVLEEIAGVPTGLAGKWLGPSRVKTMGMMSLWLVLEALGTRLALEVDRTAEARMRSRWAANPRRERHRRVGVIRKPVSPQMRAYVMRDAARKGGSILAAKLGEHGRKKRAAKGGARRWAKLSRRERRELSRQLNKKRWYKPKVVEMTNRNKECR